MFLQVYVLPNVCFCNKYFCQVLYYLFVVKFMLVIIFFCTMDVVLVKEVRLVVAVDDLDFEFRNVAFEAKVSSIGMVFLIELQIGTWKI